MWPVRTYNVIGGLFITDGLAWSTANESVSMLHLKVSCVFSWDWCEELTLTAGGMGVDSESCSIAVSIFRYMYV